MNACNRVRSWGVGSSLLVVFACGAGKKDALPPAATPSTAVDARSQCIEDADATESIPANAPAKVDVRHILVRHVALPDPRGATRSRQEACERALSALEALKSGDVEWAKAVEQFSDAKDDNLGRVAPDELNPKFAAAAFSLDVDQLSYVIETDRGFHVIWRER